MKHLSLALAATFLFAAPAAADSAMPWRKLDQSAQVRTQALYDYQANTWIPANFKPAPASPVRFAGPNEPGGPKVDPAALADPDKFTFEAIARRNGDEVKNLDYYKGRLMKPLLEAFIFPGAGKDEVPAMPLEMVKTLETHLQPGDILLQSNDPGDSKEKFRDKYLHAILYVGRGLVVHAIGVPRDTAYGPLKPSVFLSTLETGLQRDVDGADRLIVLRPTHLSQGDFNTIVEYAFAQIGMPYDFSLNTSDTVRYYCSELPYHAFKLIERPIDLPRDRSMPMGLVTGNSYLDAMDRGDFELVMMLNPKAQAQELRK